MSLRLRVGTATDIGRVRASNQDAAAVRPAVVVVADGMGGHNGGEVASQLAVDAFLESLAEPTVTAVVAAVNDANDAILERAMEDPALAGMGTTLCVLAAVETDEGERLCVANVGDSRVYLYADDALLQISEDHSLVAGLVRQGRISPDDAERHPQRNILTRALGVEPRVLVDAWEIAPVVGDRYLLCSDGLFTEVSDDRIAAVLRRLADPQEAADELVRLANEGGGRDNITVAIAELTDGGEAGDGVGLADRLTRTRLAVADVAGFLEADDPGPPEPDALEEDEATAPVVDPQAHAALEAVRRRDTSSRSRAARTLRAPRPTWRTLLFVAGLLAVVVVAVTTVAAFSASGYYVGVDDDEVVIFDGKPGGFLWMEPSVVERSGVEASRLVPADQDAVAGGVEQDSLIDAQGYLQELLARALDGDPAPGSSTTATTVAGATTSTEPGATTTGSPPTTAGSGPNL